MRLYAFFFFFFFFDKPSALSKNLMREYLEDNLSKYNIVNSSPENLENL